MTNKLWVNNDYINELTVFLAWCVALIPWNIQYVAISDIGELIFVRFPFFQIRYQLGFELGEQNLLLSPLGAYNYQIGSPMADAYIWWLIAATPLALAFLLACTLYIVDIDRVPLDIKTIEQKLPLPLARLMGGLLAIGTGATLVATYYLFTTGFQGINIPLGVVFLGLFTYLLLTNPTVERETQHD